jgi:hypothetical protein
MSLSLSLSLLALLGLSSVHADLRDYPAKPVYEPDYTAQFIPGDAPLFKPNFVIGNYAGTRDNRYDTDDEKVQTGSVDNGGVDFNYADAAGVGKFTAISGGQNVSANQAKFTGVYGLSSYYTSGDVFITDYCVIRRVDHQGIVTVYAGSFYDTFRQQYYDDIFIQEMGQSCGWNNLVPRLQAMFSYPYGLANDNSGNLYVADTENLRVRVVDYASGMVSTAVGYGHGGDTLANGLQGLACYVGHVTTVATWGANLYFVYEQAQVWSMNIATGVLTAVYIPTGAGATNPRIGAFGSLWANSANVWFAYGGDGTAQFARVAYVPTGTTVVAVVPNFLSGTDTVFDSNDQILSITGDLYNNIYYFVQVATVNAGVDSVKYCAIYTHKNYDTTNTPATLVAGGNTQKCGPSTVGEPALESKLMPGYFMAVNKYDDVLWAQHYQESYADKTFFTAGVMSLTLTQPTSVPTMQPSGQPSSRPSTQPSSQPSMQPTGQPTTQPSMQPTGRPTTQPSSQPTTQPSMQPTTQPSMQPTGQPTTQPSMQPTSQPTTQPSAQPTTQPSGQPTSQPSMQPSAQPTTQPSRQPTSQPSRQPTGQPSRQPTSQPTGQPSRQPSRQPTGQPTRQPTGQPTVQPSMQPTGQPSTQPSMVPTAQPSGVPTTQPTTQPTFMPTNAVVRLTRGEITGAVVGAIVGTAFLCVLVYFGISAYRKAHGIEEVATSSQV